MLRNQVVEQRLRLQPWLLLQRLDDARPVLLERVACQVERALARAIAHELPVEGPQGQELEAVRVLLAPRVELPFRAAALRIRPTTSSPKRPAM